MPKKPPRNNQRNRAPRTVQDAPSILRRVMQRSGVRISSENQSLGPILSQLPEVLRQHVVTVLDKGEELVILMDSAVWAARLKLALAGNPDLAAGRRTSIKVAPRGGGSR